MEELESHFDRALDERCVRYDECEALLPFVRAGKAVFGVECSGGTSTIFPITDALDFDRFVKRPSPDATREACRRHVRPRVDRRMPSRG